MEVNHRPKSQSQQPVCPSGHLLSTWLRLQVLLAMNSPMFGYILHKASNTDRTEHPHASKVTKLISESVHQKKPYSAVTVSVESLTSERYEEDDLSGIPDLVEAIKLQATGPAEAARAIRKKLKYGNVHRQLRALTLLDGLIQNAGSRFQRTFADEMLLERLRVCGTSDLSDPVVREKCKVLYRQWAVEYKNVRGLEQVAALYKVKLVLDLEIQYLMRFRNCRAESKLSLRTGRKSFARQKRIPLRMMKKKKASPQHRHPSPQSHRRSLKDPSPCLCTPPLMDIRHLEVLRLPHSSPVPPSLRKTRRKRKERLSISKRKRKL